ncbi:hypothetical protein IMG5_111970 [Ichthyophthirius multifiliis]|uniref:Cytosol aminopeptidase domain-containing protein n=1 Tax=Ichthyophthirius multifiliis TaxID=5932 RepID=G0QTU9_ICHMU|nr:hypothetical protein IMG5_111970 [Ichthyophthirius multifiliis]EGR31353.1 hypothetical protein IMG5_111970 [Ichthyophthirius multifiliis]|eukprot:XP_004034839.1 hypothetical protein IMG5_111970 [Ichthyophthirius multifiliis]
MLNIFKQVRYFSFQKQSTFAFPQLTFQDQKYPTKIQIKKQLNEQDFNQFQYKQLTKQNQQQWLYPSTQTQLLVNFCIQEEDQKKKLNKLFSQGAQCVRALHSKQIDQVDLLFDQDFSQEEIQHFLKGFLLANYKFKLVQEEKALVNQESEKDQENNDLKFQPVQDINIPNSSQEEIDFAQKVAFYTLYARQLSNLRANVVTTSFILDECKILHQQNLQKIHLEYIQGDELLKQDLNLIHAVGKASQNPPTLINLTYRGNQKSKDIDIAFIGKGVCFDAGGLNIKPTGFMETMYQDKCGAISTLSAFRAAVELDLQVNLTCTLGVVENFLSSNSYRPSDIIKSHKGLTVEIGNTDAEGRLVLADCMSWTQQKYKPKTMIELSTLTGACVVALGEEMAGLFSNCDDLSKEFEDLSKVTGELLWRLPIHSSHRKQMKGTFSDLTNSGKSRYGGASSAAAFLENFVEKDVKWVHLDIAGPVESKSDQGHLSAGMTGFGPKAPKKVTKQANKKVEKKRNPLFQSRPRSFRVGGDIQPERDLTRFVRWQKYVTLQRQKRILLQRLKVPPQIHQFSRTLDKNHSTNLFKLLQKYKPETPQEKKQRLVEAANNKAQGKKVDQKKPFVLKYGLNHITTLVENKEARLVVIAHDVDPIEIVIFLPQLCRKQGIPYALVKGKAALGQLVNKKTATAVALTSVRPEDKVALDNLASTFLTNYNNNEELRKTWGGNILGAKSQHRVDAQAQAVKDEQLKKSKL